MEVWIGHFLDNAKEWFIGWGETQDEVANFIDCTMGEPDLRSIKPLRSFGVLCFGSDIDQIDGRERVRLSPHEDEIAFDDDEILEWIIQRMRDPFPDPTLFTL